MIWRKHAGRVPWRVFVRKAKGHNGARLPGGYVLRLSAHRLRRHYFTWLKVRSVRAWPWRYGSGGNHDGISAEVKRLFKRFASLPGCMSFAAAARSMNLKRASAFSYSRLHRALTLKERDTLRRLFRARLELGRLERKAARILG